MCGMRVQGGEITVPKLLFSTFYLSQRPYLVSGSLRDQILYPYPPADVWAGAAPEARAAFDAMPAAHMSEDDRDARLEAVIEAVELDYLLGRCAALHPVVSCLVHFGVHEPLLATAVHS